jgi:hypothetical protein
MLSPNAMNQVFCSLDAGETRTENPHVAARSNASVAVQVTAVAPSGNATPDAGAQATATGGAPSVTTGAGYDTATGPSSGDVRVMSGGQLICGAPGVGSGWTGGADDPQEATR